MTKYRKKGQLDIYTPIPEKKKKSIFSWIGDIAFGFVLFVLAIEGIKWLLG
jgi:uncharacterized protein (DUF2249 family)